MVKTKINELESIKFAVRRRLDSTDWSIQIALKKGNNPYYYEIRKMVLNVILEDIEFIENQRVTKITPIKKSRYRIFKLICHIIGHKYDKLTLACKTCKITQEKLMKK